MSENRFETIHPGSPKYPKKFNGSSLDPQPDIIIDKKSGVSYLYIRSGDFPRFTPLFGEDGQYLDLMDQD